MNLEKINQGRYSEYIAVAVVILAIIWFSSIDKSDKDFKRKIASGRVDTIYIDDTAYVVKYNVTNKFFTPTDDNTDNDSNQP